MPAAMPAPSLSASLNELLWEVTSVRWAIMSHVTGWHYPRPPILVPVISEPESAIFFPLQERYETL
jgi:hypothetical protein